MVIEKLFEQQVSKNPAHPAVIGNGQRLTYEELNQAANKVARKILNKSKDKKVIALLFEHGVDMVIGVLGGIKSGKIYVPLDPTYPEERLLYILKDSTANLLITNESNLSIAKNLNLKLDNSLEIINISHLSSDISANNLDIEIADDDIAYILYTSGSTGRPKGVVQTRKNIIYFVNNYGKDLGITSDDRLTLFSAFSHDAAVMDIYGALLHGATLYPLDIKREDNLKNLAQWLIKEKITIYHSVPTLYRYFTQVLTGSEVFYDLRYIVLGGEKVIEHDLLVFKKLFHKSKKTILVNLYGQSESSYNSAQFFKTDTPIEKITLGQPVEGTEILVLNEKGEEVAPFEVGEIFILSPHVASGYWKDEEKTKKAFGEDLELGRFYRTGDLGRLLLDGRIEFVGRKDFQVKIRGYRVEPGEIESKLLAHESINGAAVTVKKREQGELLLCAFVTAKEEIDEEKLINNLRQYLLTSLPEYMIPAYITLLDKLPVTPTGKIDYKTLKEMAEKLESKREYIPPRDEVEKTLALILGEILHIDKISIDDNFFELGLHSLKAINLISKIYKEFNVKIPLKEVFETQTIRELAGRVKKAEKRSYSAIEPLPEKEYYPTSSAQKRLFLLDRITGPDIRYNMPRVLKVVGELDLERFEQAIKRLTIRHESLRTTFNMIDEEIVQIVRDEPEIFIDYQTIDEKDLKDYIQKFIRPFDLSKLPLFRVGLINLQNNKRNKEHILIFDLHHIITDGTSMSILIRDFVKLYEGKDLKPLPIQYKDFANWQNEYLQSEIIKEQKKYWLDTFADEIPQLNLPVDYPGAVAGYEGDLINFKLDAEITSKLNKLAIDSETTLFTVLLTAYNILLSRYSTEEEIVVGTPIAGRNHPDLENIVGMFVNTLALKNRVHTDLSIKELIAEIKENTLKAFENGDYQFEKLVEKLKLYRDDDKNPLFNTMLVLQNFEFNQLSIPGIDFIPMEMKVKTTRFDLTLIGIERSGELNFRMEYRTDLFARETIEKMANHFVNIIKEIITYPELKVSEIKMLSAKEVYELIQKFNNTEVYYDTNLKVHQLFSRKAQKNPHKWAVMIDDEKLTYKELDEKSNQLAGFLRELGVKTEEIVGIMFKPSLELAVGFFGILKAGGAYLPIDPDYPEERIDFMLKDSGIKYLLTKKTLIGEKIKNSFNGELIDINNEQIFERDTYKEIVTRDEDLAYVIYTSGSTGKPKGVMIEHGSFLNTLLFEKSELVITSKSRFLELLSCAFDGFITSFFVPLISGAGVVLMRKDENKDVLKIKEVLIKRQITHFSCVPSLYQAILEVLSPADELILEKVILGGEEVTDKLVEMSKKVKEDLILINEYGPTENTVVTTSLKDLHRVDKITIGRPIANNRVFIMDRNNNLLPVGVSGELCISGKGLARGYLHQKKMTEEKFIPNPYLPGERMYKTGDKARWLKDGTIEFKGRIDDQVKIRGYRIELGEIQHWLLTHPAVKEAVAIVRSDETDSKYLCAYVEVETIKKGMISGEKIKEYLKETLPEYMVPAYIILMDKMPLTPNGKIDKRALPEPDKSIKRQAEYLSPTGEVEKELARLWEEVLGVKNISVDDNFFEIGGHSLKATTLAAKISKAFDVVLPLKEIFKNPTIRDLARRVKNAKKEKYHQIVPVEKRAYYPVTSAQRRIYILEQFEGVGISYNMSTPLIISGNLDVTKLNRSFKTLIDRHEILRTHFDFINGEPVQIVNEDVDFEIDILNDLKKRDIKDEADFILSIIRDYIKPFDLKKAPLIRVGVLKLEYEKYLLIIDMHHIISDGTSVEILLDEVIKTYNGLNLPELKVQYKDFAVWQRNYLQKDIVKDQEKYWLEELKGELPVLNLPTDYKRPSVLSHEGDVYKFSFDAELTERLNSIALKNNATLYMILLGLFTTVLSKYARQEEILVGTVLAGRTHADTDNLIGLFLNNIVFRCYPSRDKTFVEYLKELKTVVINGYENQDYPIEELINKLNPQFDMSRNALFDVMLILQNFEKKADLTELNNLNISPYTNGKKTSKYDLTLYAFEHNKKLTFNLEYCTKLFKKETIERFSNHLKNIAQQVVNNPEKSLLELELITEKEKEIILNSFNHPGYDFEFDGFVHQVFKTVADRYLDKTAVIMGEKKLTYRLLIQKVKILAMVLRKLGVGRVSIVGVMVERSPEMIISLFGILSAGGAYLPLDPDYPEERIRYILQDAKAEVLITQKHLLSGIDFSGPVLLIEDSGLFLHKEEKYISFNDDTEIIMPENINQPHDLAYIIYTSGSTGKPKGVMVEHINLTGYIHAFLKEFDLREDAVVLQQASYAFDAFVEEMYPVLLRGGTLVIVKKEEVVDLFALREILEKNMVSVISCSPLIVKELNKLPPIESLKIVISGGDVLKAEYINNLVKYTKVYNTYGPTETTVCATYYQCEKGINSTIPIGKPISNYQVYILNTEGQLLPVGVPGELCVSGVGVTRGYLNRRELTTEKFINNPFIEGDRLYRTGDLARWLSDGNIEFLGRIDKQVKIRGYRIEPGEIERVLNTHPEISESVVIDWIDRDGEKCLCAYMVTEADLTVKELREFLEKELPVYMIPAYFVSLKELPLTSSGKVDKRALPEPHQGLQIGNEYIAPRNELEEKLAEIWSEVLGRKNVGIDDNFFNSGGHSLKATTMAAKVKKELNMELPLREIFKNPTIRGLSEYLKGAQKSIYTSIEKVAKRDYYPVSSAQKRMYILNQLRPDDTGYNLPGMLYIEGDLDVEKLEKTFKELINRHESLRTSFEMIKDEIVQIIHQKVEFAIEYYQVKEESEVNSIVRNFVKPFDLKRPPLLRVGLCKLADKYLLMYDMHHIIADGYSVDILVSEFLKLYEGYALPELRIQYKDFAIWQNDLFGTEYLKKQEKYWLEKFDYGKDIPLLELPGDFKRSIKRSYAGSILHFGVDEKTKGKLNELARNHGATLYMVLLAAYSILLSKYSGEEDIVIGSPIAGRPHADLDNIIGMFVNTLAMRNRPVGTKILKEYLIEVREEALKAYESQDYPFEMLIEKLDLKRDLTRNPLFDVAFALQNTNHTVLENSGDLKFSRYPEGKGVGDDVLRGAKFDLTLFAYEIPYGLSFSFEYSTELFTAETVKNMSRHFVKILEIMTSKPEIKISDIEIITAEEKALILNEFNATDEWYQKEKTINQLFEEQVEKTPDLIALGMNNKTLTYRELNGKANQLARVLRKKGVGKEKIVGLMTDRSLEMIIAILAIVKAGGAYLPFDLSYPEKRVEYMLKDSNTTLFLIGKGAKIPASYQGEVLNIDNDELYTGDTSNLENLNHPDDLIYIIYTSGSTGQPKGVMIEHRNVNRLVHDRELMKITKKDRFLQVTSIAFDASTFEIWGVFTKGAGLYLIEKEILLSAEKMAQKIKEHGINRLWLTTALFNQLIEQNPEFLTGIETLYVGGETMSPQHIKIARKHHPRLEIFNAYGPTENTTFTTLFRIDRDYEDNIPIGKPISNTKVYILDKYNKMLPVGVSGELCTAGDGLARGYLNRPQLTAERFIENPYKKGERIYKTGDLARYLSDGNLQFMGRIDHQVKVRGYRIELGEIEVQLLKYPEIREAVVDIKTDEDKNNYLCGYIVFEKEIGLLELRERLAQDLPSYMIPAHFVVMDKIPLNANGKVDRKALPEPDRGDTLKREYVKPADNIEAKLVEIWKEILSAEKIGVTESFFELGGHSLKATALAARVEREFNVDIPLREIFNNSSIRELGGYIKKAAHKEFTVIERVKEREYYPLSSAQKRMYVINNLGKDTVNYNMPFAFYVDGKIDESKLKEVFFKLIARHESLRTSFEMIDGEPVQKINKEVEFTIKDLGQINDVKTVIDEFVKPFDLSIAPLLRVALGKVDNRYLLLIDMHHIISDGVSMNIFLTELLKLYAKEDLDDLRIQYRDFAVWQNDLFKSDIFKAQERYWLSRFKGDIPTLNLPTDYQRPAVMNFAGDTYSFKLDKELSERLKNLALKREATLFMVLLAVYNILLAKYSNQEDIIVGTPIAGRPQVELEKIIGMFVNTLALRNYPVKEKTFIDFLDEVKETTIKAYENQYYQFEMLVEKLNLKRDLSRNPLFATMFVLQNMIEQEMNFEKNGLKISPYPMKGKVSKFDLTFSGVETDDHIAFSIEYSTDLFKRETIERMAEHFTILLNQVVANPLSKLSDLSILSTEEKELILERFNQTEKNLNGDVTLVELFEKQVAKTPHNIALITGNEKLTYAQLNEKANQLAWLLKEKGAGPERIVGLLMDRSAEMVIGLLAILKAGGAFLPMDKKYPAARIQYMLTDSGVEILLTKTKIMREKRITESFTKEIINLDSFDLTGYEKNNPYKTINPYNLAYVIYTSGTTGQPKGVMIEHHSIVNTLLWRKEEYGINEKDSALVLMSFAFDGFLTSFLTPLLSGAKSVLLRDEEAFDPILIKDWIVKESVTIFTCVPSLYQEILNVLSKEDTKSLRLITLGGEKFHGALIEKTLKINPGIQLINEYGPTEYSVMSTYYRVKASDREVPIGKPIANTRIYIVDQDLNPVGIGIPGEICISGKGLARGYINKEKLTAEKFVSNPFLSNTRMYRTGDKGRWLSDGNIQFLGRMDEQVKIRGYRIELGEIENRLLEYPDIKNGAVIIRGDENNPYLIAYVVSDKEINIIKLKNYLAQFLPEYMIPAHFYQIEEIPLTANGKVDVKALLKYSHEEKVVEYIAPTTPIEEKLTHIWAEILKVERIGIRDNFFDVGGHSLKATSLVAKIYQDLNVVIPLQEIFKNPTIEEQAKYIEQVEKTGYREIKKAEKRDYYPVSSAQKRMYILHQLEGETGNYNMPGALYIIGDLDKKRLFEAFTQLIQRHEALRTSFITIDGEPYQVIHEKIDFKPEYLKTTSDKVENILKDFIKPFDLRSLPLVRVKLLELVDEEKKFLLLYDTHHIIFDGTSMKILVDELIKLYSKKELPPLRIQYKDFAIWQNEFLKSDEMKEQKAFWLEQFKGELPILNLPTDYPRQPIKDFAGSVYQFKIEGKLVKDIKEFARKENATLYMLLLTVYNVLLAKYSGQEDIIVGSPIAGRVNADLENVIGMFANTLAMRNYPIMPKAFKEFFREVKENTLKAFDNQEYQFEMLVEQLNIERSLNRNPLFDTMLVLQNTREVELKQGNLRFMPYEFDRKTAKFDLLLDVAESYSKIYFELEYSTQLFTLETIKRMATHLINGLKQVIENPEISLQDINLLTEEERQKILFDFNDTRAQIPQNKVIHQLFMEQVEKTPDKPAVYFEGQFMTYGKLNERANRLAHYLRKKGAGPNKVIALMAKRSFDMIIGLLGILKAGGCYLPIDPDYPLERKNYMLKDSGTQFLLTQTDLNKEISFTGEVVYLDEPIPEENVMNPEIINTGDDLIYVIYTSGSTGQPKGVMLTHKNLINLLRYQYEKTNIDFTGRVLQFTTISFDVSFQEIFSTLLRGGELYLLKKETRDDFKKLFEFIEIHRINILFLPVSFLKFVFNEKEYARSFPTCVEHIVTAGEQLIVTETLRDYLKKNRVYLHNHYGPSETHVVTTLTLKPDEEIPELPAIGKPISNTRIYIVDEKNRLQPIGITGELCIAGEGVGRGYLNREDLTTEKFMLDPFEQGSKMYKTGDLARWLNDGNIQFLGRIDQQVKVRGFRVEVEEIEHHLLNLPQIKEAAVIVNKDESGNNYLSAFIVPSKGSLNIARLRHELAIKLPDYMIPSYFTEVDSIPLTPNGKIDKKALSTMECRVNTGIEYTSPSNEVEEKLAKIWSEVLGIERVGINGNFFTSGGHSLKATLMVTKVNKEFDIELPLREVFKTPTIKGLAEYIINNLKKSRGKYHGIKKASNRAYYPLSSAQKRLFVVNQLNKESITYNMPLALIVEGELDTERFEGAFQKLIDRHEVLRTSFVVIDGEVYQKIENTVDLKIERITGDDKELKRVIREFIKPFDLSKAPLMRVGLISSKSTKVLVFDMHHIISDGTTLNIILSDFLSFYESKDLPKLPLQYKDYAVWQNELIRSGEMKKQEEFWLAEFAGEIPVLNLPTDYPRPPVMNFEGGLYELDLPTDESIKLKSLVEKSGVTLYMALLAGLNILLARYSGQEDIIIGSPIAGRDHADIEKIAGMFVNTLALRNYPEGDKSFIGFLAEVKEKALRAYENQNYQFEMLIEKLDLERDLSRTPLFSVMFALQNIEFSKIQVENLKFAPFAVENNVTKFDLSFHAYESDAKIKFSLTYRKDLFNQDTIERMAGHLKQIIREITDNPEIKLKDIELLSSEEKKVLLVDFNQQGLLENIDGAKTLIQIFEEEVIKRPDEVALIYGSKGKTMTYIELNSRANGLAHLLRSKGVSRDEIIGIRCERSFEMLIGILAILKAGGAYMPISPDYPEERIRYMIKDSGAKLILTDKELGYDIDCEVMNLNNSVLKSRNANLKRINTAKDLAYVLYTSGSTGKPKGVMVEHRSVVNTLIHLQNRYPLNCEDIILQSTPFTFDASVRELFWWIFGGAKLCLLNYKEIDPMVILKVIKTYGVTVVKFVPVLLNEILSLALTLTEDYLSSIRYLFVGGEALSADVVRKFYQVFDKDVVFCNVYGPTETTIHCSEYQITGPVKKESVPIGKPISNVRIYVLDKYLKPVPIGVVGEIYIAGINVARGYVNNQSLTKERFIPDPFYPEEIMYKSGDLGRWLADGNLEYVGRTDFQVKIRGYRIELGEIENLLWAHPLIKNAAVTTNGQYLCAYLEIDELAVAKYYNSSEMKKENVLKEELKKYLEKKLPNYMIPQHFVLMDALPLNDSGKIDRRALPQSIEKMVNEKDLKPRDEVEKKLAEIFKEVLGLKDINIEDDFFELGGHSLLAIKLVVKALGSGFKINVQDIFRYKTIKALAELIKREELKEVKVKDLSIIKDIPQFTIREKLSEHRVSGVLLTGATGYLGVHLLEELLLSTDAKIYCLIRKKEGQSPLKRLNGILNFYFGNRYDNNLQQRIHVLEGDISKDNLGISEDHLKNITSKIDTVIHAAGLVKHFGDFDLFTEINVRGTERIIDFALKHSLRLFYISTMSVSGRGVRENGVKKFTEKDFYIGQDFDYNVYVKSKFAAENLVYKAVKEKGLKGSVLRVGNLTSRKRDGKFQINITENAFYNQIKALIEMRAVPDKMLMEQNEFTPVDECSKAIVKIIKVKESTPKIFHLYNHNKIYLKDLIKILNRLAIQISTVRINTFTERVKDILKEDDSLSLSLGMFLTYVNNEQSSLEYPGKIIPDSSLTIRYLKQLGFEWPEIDEKYLVKVIEYLKEVGFIK